MEVIWELKHGGLIIPALGQNTMIEFQKDKSRMSMSRFDILLLIILIYKTLLISSISIYSILIFGIYIKIIHKNIRN